MENLTELKKYREKLIDYYQNEDKIRSTGMTVEGNIVYLSVLNDYPRHIQNSINNILKAEKEPKQVSSGHIALSYFASILLVITIICATCGIIYFIRR